MTDVVFLLWSGKHGAWWRPGGWGYTNRIAEAGRFTEAQAVEQVVQSAMCGDLSEVTSMVAAPDNWAEPPVVEVRVVAGPGPTAQVLAEALTRLAREQPNRMGGAS